MDIAITATQAGISERQVNLFKSIILHLYDRPFVKVLRLHEGDCVGGDEQLAKAWFSLFGASQLVVHPPMSAAKRAFFLPPDSEIRRPKPYLDRNKDMVFECDLLVAAPRTRCEELRSGTWSMVREARRKKKPVVILWP